MYAPLYEHANLNEATHDNLHEMFGVANMKSFEHLQLLTNTGHLVDFDGHDVYLPHLDRLAIPITFIHGAQNECFLPERHGDHDERSGGSERDQPLQTPRDSGLRAHRLHLREECGERCLPLLYWSTWRQPSRS